MKNIHKQMRLKAIVEEFNFSPKGLIEGLLVKVADQRLQVNFGDDRDVAETFTIGQEIAMIVEHNLPTDDHSAAEHPVYRFVRLESADDIAQEGENYKDTGVVVVTGIIKRLNYSKHGEPNGVVLENGDYVHLKPEGMRQAGFKVGQTVTAIGDSRPTWNGKRVIEAESAKRDTAAKKTTPPAKAK